MNSTLKTIVWNQFGASIDMLENAIDACPSTFWNTDKKFWYNAFHCLFFLDYYLSPNPKDFAPPEPFTLSEFEDKMPDNVYSKNELLIYLQFCREKAYNFITNLTDETLKNNWVNESKTMDYPVIEILLYNMRHVQHHAAQLNLLLRQETNNAPEWVFRAK